MNAKQFSSLLIKLNACQEAREWAEGKTLAQVWTTCDRADWLLWLAGHMADERGWHTRKQVVLAACACAETALKFVPEGEERPRKAIETVRKWARGKATIDEVRTAAYAAADASAYAADAAYAAAYAADAAYAAADASAFAAAYAAAYAAYAADAAYAAAADVTRKETLEELAILVRKTLAAPKPPKGKKCQ